MLEKHALTVVNCIAAAAITFAGLLVAAAVEKERPIAALGVVLFSAMLSSAIATRMAWSRGFETGLRIGESNPADSNETADHGIKASQPDSFRAS